MASEEEACIDWLRGSTLTGVEQHTIEREDTIMARLEKGEDFVSVAFHGMKKNRGRDPYPAGTYMGWQTSVEPCVKARYLKQAGSTKEAQFADFIATRGIDDPKHLATSGDFPKEMEPLEPRSVTTTAKRVYHPGKSIIVCGLPRDEAYWKLQERGWKSFMDVERPGDRCVQNDGNPDDYSIAVSDSPNALTYFPGVKIYTEHNYIDPVVAPLVVSMIGHEFSCKFSNKMWKGDFKRYSEVECKEASHSP